MFPRVARILLYVFCTTVVAQQTNLGSLVFGEECRDDCADDRCPLSCTSCTCVGHGTPLSLTLAPRSTERTVPNRVECEEPKALPDPWPDTIFHVPKALLV
jgi:hypothetical protein